MDEELLRAVDSAVDHVDDEYVTDEELELQDLEPDRRHSVASSASSSQRAGRPSVADRPTSSAQMKHRGSVTEGKSSRRASMIDSSSRKSSQSRLLAGTAASDLKRKSSMSENEPPNRSQATNPSRRLGTTSTRRPATAKSKPVSAAEARRAYDQSLRQRLEGDRPRSNNATSRIRSQPSNRRASLASSTCSTESNSSTSSIFPSSLPSKGGRYAQARRASVAPEERSSHSIQDMSPEAVKQRHSLTTQEVQEAIARAQRAKSSTNPRVQERATERVQGLVQEMADSGSALVSAFDSLQTRSQRLEEELGESSTTLENLRRSVKDRDEEIRRLREEKRQEKVASSAKMAEEAVQEVDSSASDLKEMVLKASERIEEKWKARVAKMKEDFETQLTKEREKTSESVLSTSRLVTETKQEKEDALQSYKEENSTLLNQKKQLEIDLGAANRELEFVRSQLSSDDAARSDDAHSFWQRTTDLERKNRELNEEVTRLTQQVTKLTQHESAMRKAAQELRQETAEKIRAAKEKEAERLAMQEKLSKVEQEVSVEKDKTQQLEVSNEQLTAENTALYAQMVAQQTAHEKELEDEKKRSERRQLELNDEVRLLEQHNRVIKESSHVPTSDTASIATDMSDNVSASDCNEPNVELQEVTTELLQARRQLSEKSHQITSLEQQIAENEKVRRKLHNTIQEMKGNIRVNVRLRPFLPGDGEATTPSIMCDPIGSTLSTRTETPHTFAFDKVFGQSHDQQHVFDEVKDFIQSALDGYNVCIFAYGQTGSGKTHTMQGSGKNQMRGIIPRSIQQIIENCRELEEQGWTYTLHASFYEIYNETIRDLLTSEQDQKYAIRTDAKGRNYVDGLVRQEINLEDAQQEVENVMGTAARNRSVQKTDMNAHSSRSHSIFLLSIHGVNDVQGTEMEGTLNLVDLAGSERLGRSKATGDRLKETQAINKSLSNLANVFQALVKKTTHVPYRNSKLTYALQPALSGDGKTLMMVNLSPTESSIEESLCSLRFAQNVSQCELGTPTRQIKMQSNGSAASRMRGSRVR